MLISQPDQRFSTLHEYVIKDGTNLHFIKKVSAIDAMLCVPILI